MTNVAAEIATGKCLCGAVQFSISAPPMITLVCHCTGCRRLTGSAYSVTGVYPFDAFALVKGETVIGALHGEVRQHYCDHCKSWLYTEPPGSPVVNVRTTVLDNPPSRKPFVEIYTSEAFDWALLDARYSYEAFPPPEEFPKLAEAFAAARS
ncbi:MAG: GFA family protein [Erythrobacter sp.]